MKLTCVTAVFNAIKAGNRERLIRCVESVAALKTEHEHLIYDGSSTDGTVALLRELEERMPGLKVVSEPDTGIYNALNKGLRDAKGEWFYVLGSDDYICRPDVFDRVLNEGSADELLVTKAFWSGVDTGKERPIFLPDTLLATPYCHQGVIVRTCQVRNHGGFDERFTIAADFKLLLNLHFAGVKARYFWGNQDRFAVFGDCGLSSIRVSEMIRQFDCIVAEKLRLDVHKMSRYRDRRYLPILALVTLSCNKDLAIRTSARVMLRYGIKCVLKIVLYPIVVVTRPLRHRK